MNEEKKYGIWEYMSEQHGLTLLESEVHEIIRLARLEMELPDEEEIMAGEDETNIDCSWTKDVPIIWKAACDWLINKIRNPYPQSIRFKNDPDEFFNK